jgi:GntR family transcriptional regulator of vanillate catabolism
VTSRSLTSQSDRAVVVLRELLVQGAFSPGERLTELSLVPQLGVSRTPVRHALTRLAHEGLLQRLPQGGFRVRGFTMQEIWNAIELRGTLEGAAARLAAERLDDPAALVPVKEVLAALDEIVPRSLSEFVGYLPLNDRFHRAVWTLSGNQMLVDTLEYIVCLPFAAPSALVFGEAELPETRRAAELARSQHQAIVDAIEHRQGARAEAVAREHALIAWGNLQRAINSKKPVRFPGAALVRLPPAI